MINLGLPSNSGKTWTDRSTAGSEISGNKNWYSIAISSNGEKLAAVVGGSYSSSTVSGHLYTAWNRGRTWIDRSAQTGSGISGNKNWTSVAMSDDGQKLAAVVASGHIYTSSNSGATWTNRSTPTGSEIAGDKYWISIAMSGNGEKLAAVDGDSSGGHIYTSSNSGAKWADLSIVPDSAIGGNRIWRSIAMSDNGDELAAVAYNGHLYTATKSGTTWTWTDRSE